MKIFKIKTGDIKLLGEELKKKLAKRGVQKQAKADAGPFNPRTVKTNCKDKSFVQLGD